MARPLTATDDDIINASFLIVRRAGYDALTISQVARDIGLTRAAITQRFGGAEHLKTLVSMRQAEQLESALSQLGAPMGPDGLIEIAEFLGNKVASRSNLTSFLQGYHDTIQEDARRALEERRGRALRQAIVRVMPPSSVAPDVAADLFMAFISGSLMAWQATQSDVNAASFLKQRTVQWMQMMGLLSATSAQDDGAA